ncbi:hypothetical protein [Microvirga brassicacearum]|uniref:Uncharacterized protein n=1 Tax=Microvirga brassicacearum TaxID=2580413 RepID=A0A5N3PH92_9HYPH|nr:hypothetical protein [Microvirga brassicacearum]KAB0269088.1 hypothetical protein FEZ63_02975 [Microvirga brassicacearum]
MSNAKTIEAGAAADLSHPATITPDTPLTYGGALSLMRIAFWSQFTCAPDTMLDIRIIRTLEETMGNPVSGDDG